VSVTVSMDTQRLPFSLQHEDISNVNGYKFNSPGYHTAVLVWSLCPSSSCINCPVKWENCHHSTARPRVSDEGEGECSMEDGCEVFFFGVENIL
jgi:hypothetical protein